MRNSVKKMLGIGALSLAMWGTIGLAVASASAETTDILTLDGASIRYVVAGESEDKSGIRFSGYVNEAYLTANENAEVGMLLIPTEKLEGELTQNTASVGIAKATNFATGSLDDKEGYDRFNVVLWDIPVAQYGADITARAYIKNGDNYILSDTTVTRSIGQVASLALSKGDTAVEELNAYVAGAVKEFTAPATLNVAVGESKAIGAVITPANLTAIYESDDKAIATVDANGKVTAVKEGVTSVTITLGGESKTVVVNVVAVDSMEFEGAQDLANLYLNDDSNWAWPTRTISTEVKKDGASSLKVEPRTEAGKWPRMYFRVGGGATFDMTDYDKISVWIYNPSDEVIPGFEVTAWDAAQKKASSAQQIPAKSWVEYIIAKDALVKAGADVTALELFLGNSGSDYPNRTTFYVDSVKLGKVEVANDCIEFESADDLTLLTVDTACWPTSISTEVKKEGESSLKITPHAEWGTWNTMYFNIGGNATFDMTNYDKISVWVYNPSDTVIQSFGIRVHDADDKSIYKDHTANIEAGSWIEYSITKVALVEAGMDITSLKVYFGNFASGYENRTPFYVDCVRLTKAA